ncbi:MAG: hypothetical protein RLY93_10730 [Sumerlaeia bacterium]
MLSFLSHPRRHVFLTAAGILAVTPLCAQVTFDFDSAADLDSAIVSGDTNYFQISTAQDHDGSSSSLQFFDPAVKPAINLLTSTEEPGYPQDPFESFTYEVPIALTSGTITVDFYDPYGSPPPGPTTFEWLGSIILEDADNPADFIAIELTRLNYGGGLYYASEGVDTNSDSVFDADTGTIRTVGWHTAEFLISATESLVRVDGGAIADETVGPGGSANLRLRFMADTPTGGGMGNYLTTPDPISIPAIPGDTFYDNIVFTATAPSAATATFGFEDGETDTPDEFMGPTGFDNPNMAGFFNDFATTTTQFTEGAQSGTFFNGVETFKSIAFDLTGASAGTATVWFYDSLGPNADSDKLGGSIIIENGSDPSDFLAVEIWNFPYPSLDPAPPNNYYLTRSTAGGVGPTDFQSGVLPNRTVGWHRVDFALTNASTTVTVDGIGSATVTGPGLSTNPKIRLMADSASSGGFANYVTIDELDILYMATREPYVFFDDVTLPLSAASVTHWELYQ